MGPAVGSCSGTHISGDERRNRLEIMTMTGCPAFVRRIWISPRAKARTSKPVGGTLFTGWKGVPNALVWDGWALVGQYSAPHRDLTDHRSEVRAAGVDVYVRGHAGLDGCWPPQRMTSHDHVVAPWDRSKLSAVRVTGGPPNRSKTCWVDPRVRA